MADDEAVDHFLRMLSRVGRLESLPRMGWVVSGVPQPESVAAHVYEVAVIALWLAENIGGDVDLAAVMRIALLHDVGEALLTDLPAPVKNFIGRDAISAAEFDAAQTVLGEASASWMNAVEEYQEAVTLEARIVKASDRIQMMTRALQYEAQGRGDVRRFWEGEVQDYGIPLAGRILERIREHRERRTWFPSDLD